MLKGLFRKNQEKKESQFDFKDIDPMNVPKHVAIIMDGNGRWAQKKGLPRVAGHRAGVKTIKNIARAANQLNIQVLTLYAFSTENWKRPENEVKFLMELPQEFLIKEMDELMEQNIQVRVMGFVVELPEHTLKAVKEAEELTKNNTGLILNIAMNYGSRNELLHATNQMIQDILDGKLSQEAIDEKKISSYLLTSDFPDPELLIRTSGEQRISNFLLWQLAYSELWFTQVYWPDFSQTLFLKAIYDYQQRTRRFGGL